jgi:hypothetical protein
MAEVGHRAATSERPTVDFICSQCTPFVCTSHDRCPINPPARQLGGMLTDEEIVEFVELMDADRSGAIGVRAGRRPAGWDCCWVGLGLCGPRVLVCCPLLLV